MGQFEPCTCKGVGKIVRICDELLTDLVVDRIDLHRHVRIRHHRVVVERRIGGIDWFGVLRHVDWFPLMGTRR